MEKRACGGHEARGFHRSRTRRLLALAGLAGIVWLMSGCNATGPLEWINNGFKVGPNYSSPPAPVAQEWISAKDSHVENRHLHDWWSTFEDAALNSLIDTAFEQNLNLRVVGARVLEARAQRAIAVGNLFPQTQQMTGQYSRVGLSHNAENNPALLAGAARGLPPSAQSLLGNFYSDWSAGFNMSWELDFWGRLRRSIESADAAFDGSVDNYDDALVTLLADVATSYVQYRVAQQRIKIAGDNVRIQEGILALAEQRFKGGTGTRLDVEQARTAVEQTRSTIPALEIALGQANDQLCVLLGVPPHDLKEELGAGPELGIDPMPHTPAWVAAGIPADLLRQRPDVRSAERQVAAQSAQIGVAEAELYPTIAINGTLGLEAAELSKLFESSSFIGTVTPGFRWNILNYGRIANNVRLQSARLQEQIATYQNKVLTASREVETALRGFLKSRQKAGDLAKSVNAARAASELGMKQYSAGTIDFNRVFNLETTQVQQQDQLAVAQGNIALNLINVYRALGGGWEIREGKGNCQTTEGDVVFQGVKPAGIGAEASEASRSVPRGN